MPEFTEWKIIDRKQIARWQHQSRLKASAFLFEFFLFFCYETGQLILEIGIAI